MNDCMQCDQPATLVNHTQFAGTHYWCDAHVPPDDRDECTPIRNTQQSTNHHTNLEPTEYFLLKLVEEAAEVIQAVSKIRRFGQIKPGSYDLTLMSAGNDYGTQFGIFTEATR